MRLPTSLVEIVVRENECLKQGGGVGRVPVASAVSRFIVAL